MIAEMAEHFGTVVLVVVADDGAVDIVHGAVQSLADMLVDLLGALAEDFVEAFRHALARADAHEVPFAQRGGRHLRRGERHGDRAALQLHKHALLAGIDVREIDLVIISFEDHAPGFVGGLHPIGVAVDRESVSGGLLAPEDRGACAGGGLEGLQFRPVLRRDGQASDP